MKYFNKANLKNPKQNPFSSNAIAAEQNWKKENFDKTLERLSTK